MYTFLSGGTGTPKLLEGAREVLPDTDIAVVVNTGEDIWYQGGHISPDVDTVLYLFAGMLNTGTWWGIRDDTFVTHEMLKNLQADSYIAIGDQDRAVQLARAMMLQEGKTLTETTRFFADRFSVRALVLPMADHPYTTMILTGQGEVLHFQEYWVRYRGSVPIREVLREPAQPPQATPEVLDAIRKSRAVIIGPSNPVTSILPILECRGVREALQEKFVVSVSPFINDQPVSGPAGALMTAKGFQPCSSGLAKLYGDLVDLYVQDERDRDDIPGSLRCDTLMKNPAVAASIMHRILSCLP
jgi:LPPG:FO 2-phospho-L-lactate transferase